MRGQVFRGNGGLDGSDCLRDEPERFYPSCAILREREDS